MKVKNSQGDKPSTKPSFYYSREPPALLNIPSCAAPVYNEPITAEKFLKVSV